MLDLPFGTPSLPSARRVVEPRVASLLTRARGISPASAQDPCLRPSAAFLSCGCCQNPPRRWRLKTRDFFPQDSSGGQKPRDGFTGPTSRCHQARAPSQSSRGELIPRLLQLLGPWPHHSGFHLCGHVAFSWVSKISPYLFLVKHPPPWLPLRSIWIM